MKRNHIYTLIILLCAGLTMMSKSVHAQDPPSLVGTWTLDFTATLANASPSKKSWYDSLDTSQQTEIRDNHIGRQVTFSDDGSYTFHLVDGHTMDGQWEQSPDGSTLTTTDPAGNAMDHIIDTLDEQYLIFTNHNSHESALFEQWHFNRTTP